MEGITLNEKFTEDPKKYFQEKLMNAIFRKVLSKISRKLDVVANMHAGKCGKISTMLSFFSDLQS